MPESRSQSSWMSWDVKEALDYIETKQAVIIL